MPPIPAPRYTLWVPALIAVAFSGFFILLI